MGSFDISFVKCCNLLTMVVYIIFYCFCPLFLLLFKSLKKIFAKDCKWWCKLFWFFCVFAQNPKIISGRSSSSIICCSQSPAVVCTTKMNCNELNPFSCMRTAQTAHLQEKWQTQLFI